ncbi:Uncharacterized protein TCM_020930 [Theobroma cacao]|uniref:Ubiquitin-like domain-containing protein n=1 Tax=Theobroma cacao TaxID=3641 RepID=A0A061EN58_THECC|nr:Uncharacterized protein TCM_020930 [Theobroma cacao]
MKPTSIQVKIPETIGNLKAKVREKKGNLENDQGFFFTGELLWIVPLTRTLPSILFPTVKIRLYVKVPSDDKIMAVKVKSSDTIQKIKSIALAKESIQGKQYSLYHAGKLLEDNRTLASLNIPRKVTPNGFYSSGCPSIVPGDTKQRYNKT